jgi:hypothetical protein
MTEHKHRLPSRLALVAGLGLAIGASVGGEPERRLVRISADGAGGGVSGNSTDTVVMAYGQPDAHGRGIGGAYAYAAGVFTVLPADPLFGDGFE